MGISSVLSLYSLVKLAGWPKRAHIARGSQWVSKAIADWSLSLFLFHFRFLFLLLFLSIYLELSLSSSLYKIFWAGFNSRGSVLHLSSRFDVFHCEQDSSTTSTVSVRRRFSTKPRKTVRAVIRSKLHKLIVLEL